VRDESQLVEGMRRASPNLVGLKRFLHFFHSSHMSNVAGNMHRSSAQATDRIGDVTIHFSGVSLRGYVGCLAKAGLPAENFVELVDV
jgi:hypothetical protein